MKLDMHNCSLCNTRIGLTRKSMASEKCATNNLTTVLVANIGTTNICTMLSQLKICSKRVAISALEVMLLHFTNNIPQGLHLPHSQAIRRPTIAKQMGSVFLTVQTTAV